MSKDFQEEQFDRYLAGEMNEEEARQLEAKVEGDPLAKSDLQWHKSLVEGIKDYRYLELKTRLAAIPVSMLPPTQFWAAIGSAAVVGGITATLLLSDFNEETKDPEPTQKQEIVVANPSIEDATEEALPATESDQGSQRTEQKPQVEDASAAPSKKNQPVVAPSRVEDNEESKPIVTDPSESQEVAPIQPVMPEEDEAIHSARDESMVMAEAPSSSKASSIDVDMVANSNYDFHYKYYNHKLFLYGNLKEEPYRLLELESEGSSTLYLAYQGSYYLLQENTLTPKELKPIKDRSLKKSLEAIDKDHK